MSFRIREAGTSLVLDHPQPCTLPILGQPDLHEPMSLNKSIIRSELLVGHLNLCGKI